MTHAVKLMFFFIVSVALHGAGLWAAAGRYEAREPEAPAGVAIVDRDLFFRHAERIETRASNPVSATDRITPRSGSALRPSQPGESLARAPAVAAGDAEPERRAPASPAPGAMARLDPSIVEPAPPPRREASAPDGIGAERGEPVRMSGVDATAPPAATRPQAPRSVPAPVPARTSEALAPTGAERRASLVIAPPLRPAGDARQAARGPAPEPVVADSRRVRRPLEADAQPHARAAEPVTRTVADATVPGTLDTIAKAPAAPTQIHAPPPAAMAHVERGEPEAAPGLSAAEAPRLAPPATRAPADVAARDEIAPRPADRPVAPETVTETAAVTAAAPTADVAYATAAADAAVAPTAVPAQVPRDRPALRGTLPAPLLAARQPQAAQPVDAPPATNTTAPAPPQAEGLRLRPSLPDDLAPGRATVAAAPSGAMPAEPRTEPSPAPDPAPISRAAPRQLAAVAPQAPARRLESSDVPSGRNDPADRFTRAYQGGECFFPLRLASRDGASRDGAAIRGYGLRAESVDMFRQAFAQALGTNPEVDWRPLTDAQCGGISFTRLVLGDSAPTVRVALERKELGLGHNLAGRVTGSRLEFVTLLVVDDSGIVHNVLDHLTPEAADPAFDIPVQPVDDGTDRVQLLMAVGASRPLPILESTTPVHSDDFFPALRDQAVEAGAFLELGLEDFVILSGGTR
jgi:hypothetical protein